MKYDFIVIGSGVSGLTSAILLGMCGHRVAVVEQSALPAPLIRGFKQQGMHFDTGFHYTGALAQGEMLDLYFRHLGIAQDLEKVSYDENGFDAFHFLQDGMTFHFPYGYDRIRDRLYAVFPDEKAGIDAYLHIVDTEFNNSPHLNPNLAEDALVSFNPLNEKSIASLLEAHIRNPRLRAILSMHFMLYGTEPHLAPASLHAQVTGSLYRSVHGIRGGGMALAESMLKRLETLGAKIFTGRAVAKVLTSSGECRGVELADGEILESSGCVSSIHPRALLSIMDETALRPAARRRFAAFEDTSSAFMFYASTDIIPTILDRKNLFLCPDLNLDDYCRIDRPLESRPFFIATGLPGTQGRQGLALLCPASIEEVQPWLDTQTRRRPAEYQRMKQEMMDRVRDHLLRHVPGLSTLNMLDCATPLTFRDYANAPSGCLYGVKHKHGQIAPSPLTKIQGLLLTGQALAGPGVLGAVISAYLTCGFIIGHAHLRNEVCQCR